MRGHRRANIPEERRPRPQQQPPQQSGRLQTGPSSSASTTAAPGPSSGIRGHVTVAHDSGVTPVRHSSLAGGPEGRASTHRAERQLVPLEGKDSGKRGDGVEKGRGTMRGSRVIPTILRTRPQSCQGKRGIEGIQVPLKANYFRLMKKPNWNINLYHVEFTPPVESIGERKSLIMQHKSLFAGYIFDGTQLFSPWRMSNQEKLELVAKNRQDDPIKITVKFVKVIEIYDYQYLHVLNLILRRSMECLNLQLVGRNYFDAAKKIDIPEYKIQLWPGYKTSIRQHEQDILLCAEISYKVMRMETLFNIYQDLVRDSHNFQEIFKKTVVGTTVLTDYNNKTYRIDDVDFNSNPRKTFEIKGEQLSLIDYYKKKYGLTIRNPDQPLLVSQSTERRIRGGESQYIMLVPELCRATGITDSMRNNNRLMRVIANNTQLDPDLRIQRLNEFSTRLQRTTESSQVLSPWQLQLDTNLVELVGRVLKQEEIIFGNNKRVKSGDWKDDLKNKSLFQPIELKKWSVILTADLRSNCNSFIDQIIRLGNAMQMRISQPEYRVIDNIRTGSYLDAAELCAKNDPQLIMFIVPNINPERYGAIKKKLIVDRPIPSQVVLSRTCLSKKGIASIASKVAIQLNCKLKGAPWMVSIPVEELMTVGFDVCHSTRDPSKSYGVLVATMDLRKSTRFFSTVSCHHKGQELSNEVTLMMLKALNQFRKIHNGLPKKIIFYRDGVGEGQLHQVFEHEVKKLTKSLNEIYIKDGKKTGCPFAFIVVTKKINTRFFDKSAPNFNPKPGTVVDNIVTLPERYDFFLVSQSVQRGTASPTSYNVIYDTTGFNPTQMQTLAYKFTHLYYNWCGTLQVPAVCQYAHKLAFLIGQFVHHLPSNALETQLYFL